MIGLMSLFGKSGPGALKMPRRTKTRVQESEGDQEPIHSSCLNEKREEW